jgi:hypothetical protein
MACRTPAKWTNGRHAALVLKTKKGYTLQVKSALPIAKRYVDSAIRVTVGSTIAAHLLQGVRMYCECGCGGITAIATRNAKHLGHVKGQHLRYINHHAHKGISVPGNTFGLKHGMTQHGVTPAPEYQAYYNAKNRCENPDPDRKEFKNYGARGIRFLFTSFDQFYTELGPRPEGTTLDRIDNDGNYEPGNVRWATRDEQEQNKRVPR